MTLTPVPPAPNGAVACTADRGDPQSTVGRDLDGYMWTDAAMTNDRCRNTCASRGFVFAGTQFGSSCFCGARYGQIGPATNCNVGCSGQPGEMCGGAWANSISLSGSEPRIPAAPANGLQCAISVRGRYEDVIRKILHTYTQIEVQRWEVTGPPVPNGNGYRIPVRWTTTGFGSLHEDNGAGKVIDSKWGISGAHLAALDQVRSGGNWRISRANVPLSTVLDGVVESRQEAINGALQPPVVVRAKTGEHDYGEIRTFGYVSVQHDVRGVLGEYKGYRHPTYPLLQVGGRCEGALKLGPP